MSLAGQRFLVLLDDGVADALIRAALPADAHVRVATVREAAGFSAQLVADAAPDMILVGCSPHANQALPMIAELAASNADCPIVVLFEGNPNGFMAPAFQAGADDLIVLPQPASQLSFELQKALARRRRTDSEVEKAPMITVLGPKGGTGKTMTACNLAVALAHSGARPVVVDTDLQFGDVGLALGLRPERTIYDLAVAGGTIDDEKVDSFVLPHPSGASVLMAPTRPDQAAVITTSFLRHVFEALRNRYDYVIVDTPPAFSPEVILAIDLSSHLCVVGMLDALSLKDTKIGFETLQQMGYERDSTILVLNRADSSVGISLEDVTSLLGKSPDILVPSDRAVPRALTAGQTIYEAEPRSGAGRAFASLANIYAAETAAPGEAQFGYESDDRPGRRSILRRRGGAN